MAKNRTGYLYVYMCLFETMFGIFGQIRGLNETIILIFTMVSWNSLQIWIRARYDDVIKWKPFPRYWPFVRGIHRSPVNSPHKGQRRGALIFSLICAWINSWVNTREAGDLRRHRAHYDVTVMKFRVFMKPFQLQSRTYHIRYKCRDLNPRCVCRCPGT